MRVVALQMPSSPDERLFYGELFRALGAPVLSEASPNRIRDVCRDLLHRSGTAMLICG